MKNALYVLRYAKGTSQAEAMLNTENIKLIALAILRYAWLKASASQAVSQKKIPLNNFFLWRLFERVSG